MKTFRGLKKGDRVYLCWINGEYEILEIKDFYDSFIYNSVQYIVTPIIGNHLAFNLEYTKLNRNSCILHTYSSTIQDWIYGYLFVNEEEFIYYLKELTK